LDIAATRIYTIDELPEHPHLKAVQLFERHEHPAEGAIVGVRPPTRFARTPASVRRLAPLLGEHNDELLREAGLSDAQIADLKTKKVIRSAPPRS
ncbi:MAG TPA: CoA transferase, partial [Burkholderiaceae bacterium]|nr:CoA transferase [Burkholderiaceae bacterium]